MSSVRSVSYVRSASSVRSASFALPAPAAHPVRPVRSVPLVPAPCEVPHFAPVRVRGGRYQLRRLVRHQRRALALGLAVTAAAIVAAGPREATGPPPDVGRVRGHPVADPVRARPAVEMVTAPVRIADAATVRLLRPGDRVDVIAAEESPTGTAARVVARRARVTQVPLAPTSQDSVAEGGALVVLSVPHSTASRLAGAGATARLAVTLW
ncbi:RcpC/CpaB family pilus assembly protein [Streptomyces sp. AK08-02]|uniref:RcpC/CpaB family pilus assembly protein n=1 Tax=Streptomyces sp. AK08-02 TaxID=3028654 RepID=UPI0029B3B111|nr:RcpC/CpaB family pilus assembly protein [Streptomyces sp. AK08-02]MDX3750631.1 RcpC/CpaB family pilus assembly protein [Streptomyces sp. AK08-02]